MLHYTLNTGHTRVSPRHEVRDDVIVAMRPWLAPGRHTLTIPGYSVLTTTDRDCLIATIYHGLQPMVTVGVAPNDEAADTIWPLLESQYLKITDLPGIRSADFAAPCRPASTPWCATVLILLTSDASHWIGDFERCLAWAWVERCQS